jgi:putative endonuclease
MSKKLSKAAAKASAAVKMLVWYEHYGDVRDAIAREKQLKKWERRWKHELIEAFNAEWRDLYETLNC